uniref:Uncharacterized protein n=1 Tax=Lepeophtheirus salmonis TaxID=72036 RepID=A0A0K2V6Z5_LEPSM
MLKTLNNYQLLYFPTYLVRLIFQGNCLIWNILQMIKE